MATKTFTKKSYSNSFVICIVAIAILLITIVMQSCKKEDPGPAPEVSALSIINASPTAATYNFYLNQNKVNNGALSFGGAIPYFQLRSGLFSASLTTESSTESLFTDELTFENNKVYSLFITGKADNLDYLLINDNLKEPVAEKAFIRFINLSPDAPALNLAFKDSTAVVTDKAFKAASEFIEVPAKVYTFEIKDKATGNVEKELKDIDLKAGKTYTIISRGLMDPSDSDQPFGGQVITNN